MGDHTHHSYEDSGGGGSGAPTNASYVTVELMQHSPLNVSSPRAAASHSLMVESIAQSLSLSLSMVSPRILQSPQTPSHFMMRVALTTTNAR